MIDISEAKVESIIIHWVGNKNEEEGLVLSDNQIDLYENPIGELLGKYFLSPFQGTAQFEFTHDASLDLNAIYTYAKHIFTDKSSLRTQSVNICNHLYDTSSHPKIKSGEVYVVLLSNCYYEGEETEAIGVFKSENKETYLKVLRNKSTFGLTTEEGINIKKLDKGCLIANVSEDKGYRVYMIDNINKTDDAQYWRDYFLKVKPVEDEFLFTKNYMDLCRGFVKEVYNQEHSVNKPDQINMLNKSLNYFKKNDTFVEDDFMVNVIQEPEVIEAFKDYKTNYVQETKASLPDEAFEINPYAYKNAKGAFKSTLKLDKNFHVYIHGDKQMIEKGYDQEREMNFYKLYYTNEQ
ncbi:MAG: nucleoid-associated protein [Bacteroidota bacterium]